MKQNIEYGYILINTTKEMVLLSGKDLSVYKELTKLTQQKYESYMRLRQDNKIIYYVNGDIKHSDSATTFWDKDKQEWVIDQNAITDAAKRQIIAEAQSIYNQNEYRWTNQIMWSRYTDDEKEKLMAFHDQLLDVIAGKSDIIPKLE